MGEKTARRYAAMLRRFRRFEVLQRSRLTPRDPLQADLLAEEFVEWLYRKGAPLSWASDFLSALGDLHPSLRRSLPGAWRTFSVWAREYPPDRAPPLPRRLLLLWVGRCIAAGEWAWAALFLTMFHAYLRPGEALALRRSDVAFHTSGRARAVICLRSTKTSGRKRAAEFVDIEDPFVAFVLRMACELVGPDDFLFVFTYNDLRLRIRALSTEVGVEAFGFRPYSFRRGGASWDFRVHGSFDRAMLRGRWKNLSSAQVYLTDARAAAVACLLPAPALCLARQHVAFLGALARQSGVVGGSPVLSGAGPS